MVSDVDYFSIIAAMFLVGFMVTHDASGPLITWAIIFGATAAYVHNKKGDDGE